MKKLLMNLFWIALMVSSAIAVMPVASAAQAPLLLNVYPVSAKVQYRTTEQTFRLQYYLVNTTSVAQPISDFHLTGSSHDITVKGFTNDCHNSVPASPGVCNVYAEVTAKGYTGTGAVPPAAAYRFSLNYGSPGRLHPLTATTPVTFSFADGAALTSQSRTFKFVNNCSQTISFGIESGTVNALNQDPAHPADPAACETDASSPYGCPIGATCANVSTGLNHCFWNNPTPDPNTYASYQLAPNGGTNTVTFPVYNNGIDVSWNGGIAGRTGCTESTTVPCTSGDCGKVTDGVYGGECAFTGGFGQYNTPATLAEFSLLASNPVVMSNTPNGNTDVDTYDISVINGVNIGVSMGPTTTSWGGAKNPYFCGVAGGWAEDPSTISPLGSCSWQMNPPSQADYTFVEYPGGTPTPCSDSNPCGAGETCGLAADGAGSIVQVCSSTALGNWTADGVCAASKAHPYNASPFFCSTDLPVPPPASLAPLSGYFYSDLYGCPAIGAGNGGTLLHESCYTAGAPATCCGCANWDLFGIQIPTTQGTSPLTAPCVNTGNTIWSSSVQSKLLWLKAACPTSYTYPYDDKSSTFTCQTLASKNAPNITDYTVTFCPAPDA